jgi:hypothetical protein
MIKKLSALTAIVLVIAAASCKKSNNDTPASINIQGTWTIFQDWDWFYYTSTGAYEDGGRLNPNTSVVITVNASQWITYDPTNSAQSTDTSTYKTIGNSYVVLDGVDSAKVLHYSTDTLVLVTTELTTDGLGNNVTETDTLGLARKQ